MAQNRELTYLLCNDWRKHCIPLQLTLWFGGHYLFSDILSTSIQRFQADCLQLCEQHYPTVHNRGMRENHLGKALCRRIITTLENTGIHAHLTQKQNSELLPQPIFHIQTDTFAVWVIAHRLLSANLACRQNLVNTIIHTQSSMSIDQPQHLVIIADHWFDRSKASKEIPAWWLGALPTNMADYLQDGIRLLTPTTALAEQLSSLPLTKSQFQIHHPLKRENGGKIVYKYLLLTAHCCL